MTTSYNNMTRRRFASPARAGGVASIPSLLLAVFGVSWLGGGNVVATAFAPPPVLPRRPVSLDRTAAGPWGLLREHSNNMRLQASTMMPSSASGAMNATMDRVVVESSSSSEEQATPVMDPVEQAATTPREQPLSATKDDNNTSSSSCTAVVLNLNARSVTAEMAQVAIEVLGSADHVFLTTTPEEAQEAARDIVASGNYQLVVPVGGDGTLACLIQYMVEAHMEQQQQQPNATSCTIEQAMAQLPAVGYIPLGTGNGVGSVVGCHPTLPEKSWRRRLFSRRKQRRLDALRHVLESLQAAGRQLDQQNELNDENAEVDLVELPMIQVLPHSNKNNSTSSGDLCFFAGSGFDSLMLDDYKSLQAWSRRTGWFRSTLSSVTGYCVALVVKTLPHCISTGAHNIRVRLTTSQPAGCSWVDHRRGDFLRPVIPSSRRQKESKNKEHLLFTGRTGILAAGTSPFYGGGLRLFPFARLCGATTQQQQQYTMHLRLGRIHPWTGFMNLPGIFAGSYRHADFGCIDLIGSDFDVQVQSYHNDDKSSEERSKKKKKRGFPFQHSGESVGHVDSFRLRVVQEPVRFVSLIQPQWENEEDDSMFLEDEDEGLPPVVSEFE